MLYHTSVTAWCRRYFTVQSGCTWCTRMVVVINVDRSTCISQSAIFPYFWRSARSRRLDHAAPVILVAASVADEAGLASATLIRWPLRVFALGGFASGTFATGATTLVEVSRRVRPRVLSRSPCWHRRAASSACLVAKALHEACITFAITFLLLAGVFSRGGCV
jgi:hypothetical protein